MSQHTRGAKAQEDHVLAADIEPTEKTPEDRVPARRTPPKVTARKVVKPLRSVAIFGAVGALVAAVALPAYAASKPADAATTTVQQLAAVDAQSLVVASEATSAPVVRGTFSATTPDEIAKKKAEEAAAARAAAAATAAASSSGGRFNTAGYALTAPGSGEVRYPLPLGSWHVSRTIGGGHNGIDMLAPAGTPIYAAAAGVVRASAENIGGYGVCVMLDSVIGGQRVQTTYGHMLYGSRQVQAGQSVAAGQLIGYVGSTGRSTANHLHFEVWINGGLVEPGNWLSINAG
ncbi:M23 family metallopeptidase [Microbacterium sufflavum]|uniref:M23 family metallopeptidase n=1 Tax=Microbacterium sufflavum TaxID=2851649 RepID=A0ABY4IDN6_9MICO|nr:M23 family metallopeptidase [Aneurinibacillus sp. BA2021]MCK2024691.1 M23 family metallopeptidase [Microbacterium sufflavum]UPL09608.1 M23 family metallopeptidase [Microbacterium sufflavum]